jgi:hypothetical protein
VVPSPPPIGGGIQVRDFIKAELRTHKDQARNLSTKFWCRFSAQYDFGSSLMDDLELPLDTLGVSSDLLSKISVCHESNPATRSTEPLERYLEFCQPLNRREIYGILAACEESHSLSRSFSIQMKTSVLKYFARIAHILFHTYIYINRFIYIYINIYTHLYCFLDFCPPYGPHMIIIVGVYKHVYLYRPYVRLWFTIFVLHVHFLFSCYI